jgi:hypothetical protein
MKITDTTGRNMLVDLVYKDPQYGWLKAPTHTLKGRGTQFLAVPHGEYAIRICSLKGAEVIVYDNGKRMIRTLVPAMTQIIKADSEGQAFTFRAPGDNRQGAKTLDSGVHADIKDAAPAAKEDSAEDAVAFKGPEPLKGDGMVYVVVRFAKENNPFGEPPQEEFEVAFQMMEPSACSEHFAENLHLMVEAPALVNPLDPFSHTPPTKKELANRPHVQCTCCMPRKR